MSGTIKDFDANGNPQISFGDRLHALKFRKSKSENTLVVLSYDNGNLFGLALDEKQAIELCDYLNESFPDKS